MKKMHWLRVLLLLSVTVLTAPVAQAFNCCRAADVIPDGLVDDADLADIREHFGVVDPRRDLDGNGTVGPEDVELAENFLGRDCTRWCRADLDGNRHVDIVDLFTLEDALDEEWPRCIALPECSDDDPACAGNRCRAADFNRNGIVEFSDRWWLLAEWGPCPGEPSPPTMLRGNPPNPCAEDPYNMIPPPIVSRLTIP